MPRQPRVTPSGQAAGSERSFGALMRELTADVSQQPDLTVMVRAHENLNEAYVMMIMKAVDRYGIMPELETDDTFTADTL